MFKTVFGEFNQWCVSTTFKYHFLGGNGDDAPDDDGDDDGDDAPGRP